MLTIQNEFSRFSCDPKRGLQWCDLSFLGFPNSDQPSESLQWIGVLDSFRPQEDFFSSGSFVMFPWVNRMHPNSYRNSQFVTDGNGLPLHGLVYDKEWKILDHSKDRFAFSLEFQLFQESMGQMIDRPGELQIDFTLKEKSLAISGRIINRSKTDWLCAWGLHPYFQISESIDSLELEFSSPTEKLILNEKLLPMMENNDLKKIELNEQTFCLKNMQFDDLFHMSKGIHVKLKNHHMRYGIELKDVGIFDEHYEAVKMEYLQIYTPEHRKSIAIEPMSAPGNIENLPKRTNVTINSESEKKFNFLISFFAC